ncbi:MAG: glycosyltransferase [Candidatus Methanomethylicia archaeon]
MLKRKICAALIIPPQVYFIPETGGGAWVRFFKVYKYISNHLDLKFISITRNYNKFYRYLYGYDSVLFKSIVYFKDLLFMISNSNLFKSSDMIIYPAENYPQYMVLSYLASRIYNRPLIIFTNTVPVVGSTEIIEDNVIDLKNIKNILYLFLRFEKSIFYKLFYAIAWYFALKILKDKRVFLVSLTPFVSAKIKHLGVARNIIEVYPGNGIDVLESCRLDSRKKILDALFVSSVLHPLKGIYDLIPIWYIVTRNMPDAKLGIVGKVPGELLKIIEKFNYLIRKYNLQNNIFILNDPRCTITREKVMKVMQQAKIFLYPSRKDVWPLVIGEAVACSVPVVTYALPDIKYAYGACPLVFFHEVGDYRAMAATIERLLKNYDTLVNEAWEKSKEYFKRYTWERAAKLELIAYLNALKSFYKQYAKN